MSKYTIMAFKIKECFGKYPKTNSEFSPEVGRQDDPLLVSGQILCQSSCQGRIQRTMLCFFPLKSLTPQETCHFLYEGWCWDQNNYIHAFNWFWFWWFGLIISFESIHIRINGSRVVAIPASLHSFQIGVQIEADSSKYIAPKSSQLLPSLLQGFVDRIILPKSLMFQHF